MDVLFRIVLPLPEAADRFCTPVGAAEPQPGQGGLVQTYRLYKLRTSSAILVATALSVFIPMLLQHYLPQL